MIIEKNLLPLQPFEIPVKGLKNGKNVFHWHTDGSFFSEFGNAEILGADLEIEAEVDFTDFELSVACRIDGSVTVACDRCLEDLALPVHAAFETEADGAVRVLDLSQDIYDEVCVSLPLRKVHPEGECNAETLQYLSK